MTSQIFVFNPEVDEQCESVDADQSDDNEGEVYKTSGSQINEDDEEYDEYAQVNHLTMGDDDESIGPYRQKHNSENYIAPMLGCSTDRP